MESADVRAGESERRRSVRCQYAMRGEVERATEVGITGAVGRAGCVGLGGAAKGRREERDATTGGRMAAMALLEQFRRSSLKVFYKGSEEEGSTEVALVWFSRIWP